MRGVQGLMTALPEEARPAGQERGPGSEGGAAGGGAQGSLQA
jgi:hypothetical protein